MSLDKQQKSKKKKYKIKKKIKYIKKRYVDKPLRYN